MTSHVTSGALNAADMSDTSNNSHRKACSFAQVFQEDYGSSRIQKTNGWSEGKRDHHQ